MKPDVTLGTSRGPLVRATALAEVDGQTVAEADLLLAVQQTAQIDPSAKASPKAVIGVGTTVGPFADADRTCASAATATSAHPP